MQWFAHAHALVSVTEKLLHSFYLRGDDKRDGLFTLSSRAKVKIFNTSHWLHSFLKFPFPFPPVSGGRTRLHLLDLGSGRYGYRHCARSESAAAGRDTILQRTDDIQPAPTQMKNSLSFAGMANVLLALLTGQRRLPFNDSALTYLLREAVVGTKLQPCILAHVTANVQYHSETLQVCLSVRVHVYVRNSVKFAQTHMPVWCTHVAIRIRLLKLVSRRPRN